MSCLRKFLDYGEQVRSFHISIDFFRGEVREDPVLFEIMIEEIFEEMVDDLAGIIQDGVVSSSALQDHNAVEHPRRPRCRSSGRRCSARRRGAVRRGDPDGGQPLDGNQYAGSREMTGAVRHRPFDPD